MWRQLLSNQKIKKQNIANDLKYLRNFRTFLIELLLRNADSNLADYFSIAIAHLFFIDDQGEEGKKYLEKVSPNADSGILLQKQIDELKT